MAGWSTRLRIATALAVGLSASACTSDGEVGSAGLMVYTLFEQGLFGGDEGEAKPAAGTKIERKMAADLPYAS